MLLVAGEVKPLYVLSLIGLSLVASLITSLAGLPEVKGTSAPFWQAIVVRVLKTAAQVAVPAIGAAVIVQDVDWQQLGVQVGGAALTTLVRSLMDYLPESDTTVQIVTGEIVDPVPTPVTNTPPIDAVGAVIPPVEPPPGEPPLV
jgi:hypothetical protein